VILDGLDLRLHELELREELFHFLAETADTRADGLPFVAAPRAGEIVP